MATVHPGQIKLRRLALVLIILIAGGFLAIVVVRRVTPVPPPAPSPQRETVEWFEIVDADTGTILDYVPYKVVVGDQLITANNRLFRVFKVQGTRAWATEVKSPPGGDPSGSTR